MNDDSISQKFPIGWEIANVNDCFLDVRNGTTAKQNKHGKGIPVSRIETIQNAQFDPSRVQHIENIDDQTIEKFRYHPGDIAFSHINSFEHVGKTALYEGIPPQFIHGMNLLRLRLGHDHIVPKFVYLYMQSQAFRDEVRHKAGQAVNQVSINQTALGKILLPLCPLPEQKRIVAKVEELLARVNAARERLARVPAILKRFRQSVLAAACSGRLTADWRADSTESEFPETWQTTDAGNSYTDARYGTSQKCHRQCDGIPVLRVPNIAKGVLDLNDLKFTELSDKDKDSLALHDGDIIVCRTNGSLDLVGKAAVIPALNKPYAFASYLIRLRFDRSAVVPAYFHSFLSSPTGREQIEARARTTAGQFNLNLEILRNLQLPVPPSTTNKKSSAASKPTSNSPTPSKSEPPQPNSASRK